MCVWHGRVGLHCNCSIRSGLALRQYELLMLPCLRSCCGLEQMVRSFVAKYWAVGSTQPFLPAPAHQPNLLSPWTCFALQIPTQQASPNFPPCRFLASSWARPVSSVGALTHCVCDECVPVAILAQAGVPVAILTPFFGSLGCARSLGCRCSGERWRVSCGRCRQERLGTTCTGTTRTCLSVLGMTGKNA
jgi:hypothetical protein